jgi:hypothetical protein
MFRLQNKYISLHTQLPLLAKGIFGTMTLGVVAINTTSNNTKRIAHIKNATILHDLQEKDVLNTNIRISNCNNIHSASFPTFPNARTLFFDASCDHHTTYYLYDKHTFPKVQDVYFEHFKLAKLVLARYPDIKLHIVNYDNSKPIKNTISSIESITKQQYNDLLKERATEDFKTVVHA